MINIEELREKILDTLVKNGTTVSCVANHVGMPVMDAIMETIAAELNDSELEYAIIATGVADGYGDELCKKVNKMIKKGWAPHGGLAAPVQQGVGLVQAMVRRKKMSDYITTEELKQEIENLGFSVRVDYRLMEVTSPVGDTLAKISKIQTHALNVLYPEFITRTIPDVQAKLYNLLDRYARTPIEKRGNQKMYRLKLNINDKINIFDGEYRYLARSKQNNICCLSLASSSKTYQNIFTQSEIDEMGDLTKGFVKEEV